MVQLIGFNQSTGVPEAYLDVSGGASIPVTYSALEIQDISKRNSNISHSFRLPFTQTNNQYFENAFDVNISESTFNIYAKARAQILEDSIPVLEGYIRINKVYWKAKQYEVVVFGDLANLQRDIGEKKLNALDFSELNHVFTRSNIEKSWTANSLSLSSGGTDTNQEILYPLIDWGRGYTADGGGITTNDGAVIDKEFRPALSVRSIFKKIIAEAGYDIASDFIDDSGNAFFGKQYMTLGTDQQSTVAITDTCGFRVSNTAAAVITENTLTTLAFNDDSTDPNYDLGADWDTSSYHFTTPQGGDYVFEYNIGLRITFGGTNRVAQAYVSAWNGSTQLNESYHWIPVGWGGDSSPNRTTITGQLIVEDIASAQDITFKITWSEVMDSGITEFKVGTDIDDTYLTLTQIPSNVIGGTVVLAENMPDIKQIDFLKAIISRYNLVVVPDVDNSRMLNIEPYVDYIADGTSVDWTDKLDTSKEMVLEPTNKYRKDLIEFKDLDDDDWGTKLFKQNADKIYGQYREFEDQPFSTGELKNYSIFAPCIPKPISGTGSSPFIMQLYSVNDGEKSAMKVKPRLFFYSGLKNAFDGTATWKVYDTSGASYSSYDTYPFCHHYSLQSGADVLQVQAADVDLNFGVQYPLGAFTLLQNQTLKTSYREYWAQYINEIFSDDSRVLTANLFLEPKDIFDLRFNNQYWIKNSYYRINKINGYQVGASMSTQVELIKIVNSLPTECSVIPDAPNIDGYWSFKDPATGSSATATQECCERFGYRWFNSKCWWRTPAITLAPHSYVHEPKNMGNIETGTGNVIIGKFNKTE